MFLFVFIFLDDFVGNDFKYCVFDVLGVEFFEGRVNGFNILLIDFFKKYVLFFFDV